MIGFGWEVRRRIRRGGEDGRQLVHLGVELLELFVEGGLAELVAHMSVG